MRKLSGSSGAIQSVRDSSSIYISSLILSKQRLYTCHDQLLCKMLIVCLDRHKMTTLTPSLHMESYSPDDNRFDLRFVHPLYIQTLPISLCPSREARESKDC
jgi:hypothetical protein